MDKLTVKNLSYAYCGADVISDVSLRVAPGEFVGIIGPNGSGKSTVLKNIYGSLRSDRGTILLDGEDLKRMRAKRAAAKMAVVGQENELAFDFCVADVVAMGRTPYKGLLEPDSCEDRQIVRQALEQVGLLEYADRNYRSLSGGERQRAVIARALAQKTGFLILDEPTNHLDISFQLQVLELVKSTGLTVLAAIHDLNLAALFCDRIYVLSGRRVYASGTASDVLSARLIKEVFGVSADVGSRTAEGRPIIVYVPESAGKREVKYEAS